MNETYETLFLILFLFQLKLCSFSFSDAKVRRISLRNKKNRHFFPDLLRQQARYATKQERSGICCRKNITITFLARLYCLCTTKIPSLPRFKRPFNEYGAKIVQLLFQLSGNCFAFVILFI